MYQAVKVEGVKWKEDADKLVDTQPATAYDLYTKIANVFAGDDLAKSVADPLKALKTNKAVTDEMAARQMYAQLFKVVPNARVQQRDQVVKFCSSISTKYPGTPTADKARSLADAIALAPKAE